MSRILKKLNIDTEVSTPERSGPDLKLVPEPEHVQKPRKKKHPSKNKAKIQGKINLLIFNIKKFSRRLIMISVVVAVLIGLYFGCRFAANYVYDKIPKAAPAAIEAVSVKAKLEADEQIHRDAKAFYNNREYEKALDQFQVLLKKHPVDSALLNNVGLTYLKMNNLPKAEWQFQETLKIDPKDGGAYNNLGSLKIAQQNWEEAIAYFYQAILYHPEMIEPHLNLAKAYEMAGRPMEAIPEYQYYLDHVLPSNNPELKKMVEKRIVKLNSFARYLESE
jgi:tetratricopeptide (TPR) repeat protein